MVVCVCLLLASCKQATKEAQGVHAEKILVQKVALPVDSGNALLQKDAMHSAQRPLLAKSGHTSVRLGGLVANSFIDHAKISIPEEAQGKGVFAEYTTDDGLALDQVHCMLKDRQGHLWLGTNGGGVSRFDGRKFTNFTNLHGLAGNVVWCMLEDQEGNLWFGTDGNGVSKFDGKRFTNFDTKNGLSGDIVLSIAEDKSGHLWFGTSTGVTQYDGTKFTKYTKGSGFPINPIKDILKDAQGNLWFASFGDGLTKFDGLHLTQYRKKDGLASDSIKCIYQDAKGQIWAGTNTAGLTVYDGKNFRHYTVRDGLSSNEAMTIVGDEKGDIWVGTNGGGISKFDGVQFINYNSRNGLESGKITSVVEDERGNLWLGTFGGGVVKFSVGGFSNFTTKQGLPNNIIYGITEDNRGDLWFGSFGGGITKYDRKSLTTYSIKQGLPNSNIYCAKKDSKGHLWFGTFQGGVIRFDGTKFTQYTKRDGLADDIVFCINEDKKGNLWFGTSTGGVSKFDGQSFTNYATEQGLPAKGVFTIANDDAGNLWFGTYGGGVSRFDGKSFINLSLQHGLADNTVWAITVDAEKNIWFGTQQGLSVLTKDIAQAVAQLTARDTVFTKPLFQKFTVRDGLPDDFVTQVVEARNNTLYVGTNMGICEIMPSSKKGSQAAAWKVGRVFNAVNGFPIKDVNVGQGAMFQDSKGIFWIATGSEKTGLVRFDPAAIKQAKTKPPFLLLQSMKVNNERLVWNDLDVSNTADNHTLYDKAVVIEEMSTFGRQLINEERRDQRNKFGQIAFSGIRSWYSIPEKLVLPFDQNSVSFGFNAIQADKNYLIQYQYLLEGYDKNWSPWTTNNSASFGNMDEGEYTFRVRARNDQGLLSAPIAYSFTVNPPWWRTWWMYLLYLLLGVTAFRLMVIWKNRRVIQQKKRLEYRVKIATEQIRSEKENVEVQRQIAEEALQQLKGAQAQLIHSEKMASLGELTAGIAHEIQNPLNFVNNFSEVSAELLEEMKAELNKGSVDSANEIAGEIQQSLEKIHFHGKRASDIVKSMLQHSRSGGGPKEAININALCDEYLRLAYHGFKAKDKNFNVGFNTKLDEAVGLVELMPQEIGRVILNLINNALYAVSEKKKLGIEGYEPMVTVETKKLDNAVKIRIVDNGMGIPDQLRGKILQPFFTTKPTGDGTGLGLSLSYDIVTVGHGGSLSFESVVGEGTTFEVELPV